MAGKKAKGPKGYRDVRLTGYARERDVEDGDGFEPYTEFVLEYFPLVEKGKPQRVTLDAETESDARFEAANILECPEDDLPETEYD